MRHKAEPSGSRFAWIAGPLPGRLAFVILLAYSVLMTIGGLPLFGLESVRDWWTYDLSGENLIAGRDLYFDAGRIINLYPPSMAMLWAAGVSSTVWMAAAAASLVSLGLLGRGREALAIVLLTFLQPPVQYDLLLGNVTAFYIAAIAIRLWKPSFAAGIPLGIVLALAPKPAVIPLMLVLLIRTPRRALDTIGVALAITIAVAIAVGPELYVRFFEALLDSQRQLAGWTTGNLGLSRHGPFAISAGLAVAAITVFIAIRWLSIDGALAVSLGAGSLVQATLGYYYAAFFIPGVILLWRKEPKIALPGALVVSLLSLATPVAGGVALIAAAMLAEWHERRATGIPPNAGSAAPQAGVVTQ